MNLQPSSFIYGNNNQQNFFDPSKKRSSDGDVTNRIANVILNSPGQVSQKRLPLNLLAYKAETLWTSDNVKVVMVEENSCFHLIVRPKKKLSLEGIPGEDYIAIKKTIQSISNALEKKLGSSDYAEFMLESNETFGFEILPPPPYSQKQEVDLLAKDKRNLYMFSKGQLEQYSLPIEKVTELKAAIKNELSQKKQIKISRPFLFKRFEINVKEALDYRISIVEKLLKDSKGKNLPQEEQIHEIPPLRERIAKPNCFFCHLKNPDENVYEGNLLDILVNVFPYARKLDEISKHLLLIPRRHVEEEIELTDEEILEERKCILMLREKYKEIDPEGEFFIWRQHGVKAGHTVPHIHIQMLRLTGKDLEIGNYFDLLIKDIVGGTENLERSNSSNEVLRNILQAQN